MITTKNHNLSVMFKNSKGKYSPSIFVGFYACFIAVTVFLFAAFEAVFFPQNEETNMILTTLTVQSIALFTAGGTLLGIRRFTKDKEINNEQSEN